MGISHFFSFYQGYAFARKQQDWSEGQYVWWQQEHIRKLLKHLRLSYPSQFHSWSEELELFQPQDALLTIPAVDYAKEAQEGLNIWSLSNLKLKDHPLVRSRVHHLKPRTFRSLSLNEYWFETGKLLGSLLSNGLWKPQRVAFIVDHAHSVEIPSPSLWTIDVTVFQGTIGDSVLVEHLTHFKPDLIVASGNILRWLSEDHWVDLSDWSEAICVDVVLDPMLVDDLAAQDKTCKHLFFDYDGVMAHTCEYGTLHMDASWFIEPIYLDPYHIQPRVTDLSATSQPWIRRTLNTVWRVKQEACPCGRGGWAFDWVEGHAEEQCVGRSADGRDVRIYNQTFAREIAKYLPLSSNYRLIQENRSMLLEAEANQHELSLLRAGLLRYLKSLDVDVYRTALHVQQRLEWPSTITRREIKRRLDPLDQSW